MVRIYPEDVGGISLAFRAHPWVSVSALKGLDKVVPAETVMAWNVHAWQLQ